MAGLIVSLAVAAFWLASSTSVTPIEKVLQLLQEMKGKATEEMKQEQVRFSAFKEFCSGTNQLKAEAIEQSTRRIEKLEADVMKAATDIEALIGDIDAIEGRLSQVSLEEKAATSERDNASSIYEVSHRDYADTIDALDRALALLRELPRAVPQDALLQLRNLSAAARQEPAQARQALAALLRQPTITAPGSTRRLALAEGSAPSGQGLDYQAPKANAYEFQSGGVLAMLEDLRQRFRDEMHDLQKEELASKHAYQMVMQRLTDQAELATQELGQKKKRKAQREQDAAQGKAELEEEKSTKAEDEKYLTDLTSLCSQKAKDFESRQLLRTQELQAMAQAIELLSGPAVSTGRAHLPGAVAGSSLAQLREGSGTSPATGARLQQALALLHERAIALRSHMLQEAATKAKDDPFAKVKKMIQNLIIKLLEEANQEADHHGWCTAELATNKQTRTWKAEAVEELAAEVEKLTAASARLAQEIADLSDEMAGLEAAVSKATAERQKEKAANEQTIKEAREAQTAVAQALAVLRDFYAKAAEATVLLQGKQSPLEDAPETFDAPYQGRQGESEGVIGFLEVIESDFSRLAAETDAAESGAASAHRSFVAEADQDKAVKATERKHRVEKKQRTDELLGSTKRSLEQTQKELDAALAYYNKLKPSCVDMGASYEERVQLRKEEMETLKEAYKILSGEDVPSFQEMKAEQIGRD